MLSRPFPPGPESGAGTGRESMPPRCYEQAQSGLMVVKSVAAIKLPTDAGLPPLRTVSAPSWPLASALYRSRLQRLHFLVHAHDDRRPRLLRALDDLPGGLCKGGVRQLGESFSLSSLHGLP